MANINLIKIGGVSIKTPSKYQAQTSTIVTGGRNVKGVYIGTVTRENVMKISMSWNFIEPSDWATIVQLFSSTYGGSFIQTVHFLDQDTGTFDETDRKFYVSDRKADVMLFDNNGNLRGYQNATLNLIEV